MEEIIITFDEDGPGVKVEASGVRGAGCKALTRPYEEALGLVGPDTLKPEYHQVTVKTAVQIGGGK